jgi:hypothetical protein
MPAKGQKMPTIDEKIERLQDQALLYKKKYEETLEQVKLLMEKRDQKQQEELIAKFLKSNKTYEQVMAFLDEDGDNNDE